MAYGKPIDMGAKLRQAAKEDAEAKRKALAKETKKPQNPFAKKDKEDKEDEEKEEKEKEGEK
jgi:hypothetical protein